MSHQSTFISTSLTRQVSVSAEGGGGGVEGKVSLFGVFAPGSHTHFPPSSLRWIEETSFLSDTRTTARTYGRTRTHTRTNGPRVPSPLRPTLLTPLPPSTSLHIIFLHLLPPTVSRNRDRPDSEKDFNVDVKPRSATTVTPIFVHRSSSYL